MTVNFAKGPFKPLEFDPVEETAQYKVVEDEVNRRATIEAGEIRRGHCHRFWSAKQRILLEEHGIRWKSPAEMNPWYLFD